MQHAGPSQFCRAPACSSQVVKYRDAASYLLLLKASEDAHTSPLKEALSRSTQPLSVKHSVSSSSPPESSLAGTPATSAKQLDWLNASVNAAVLGLRMLPPSQRGLAAPRPAESERLDSRARHSPGGLLVHATVPAVGVLNLVHLVRGDLHAARAVGQFPGLQP